MKDLIKKILSEEKSLLYVPNPQKINELKNKLKYINNQLISKYEEIDDLNYDKNRILNKLRELESILNPKIEVKKMVSNREGVDDYYRAITYIWVNNTKKRIISYVGLTKNFKGDENSDEVKKVASSKIKETISKQYQIINQDSDI